LEKYSLIAERNHLAVLTKDTSDGVSYINDLFSTYAEVAGIWTLANFLSKELENLVLEKKIAQSEEEIRLQIRPYSRLTWLEQQNREIKLLTESLIEKEAYLSVADINQSFIEKHHPEIYSKLLFHVRGFDWFGTHHWIGDSYTLDTALEEMRSFFERRVVSKNDFVDVSNTGSLDEYEYLWRLLASLAYWRTHAAEVTAKTVFRSRKVLTTLAQGWGLRYKELIRLSRSEIQCMMNMNPQQCILPDNFASRLNGYGCIIDSLGKECIVVGDELQHIIRQVIPKIDSDVSEFRGVVASGGGSVRGRVIMVTSSADIGKFKEGGILVASETTPNFVPVMKKAKAIITETGGITSHAAIVSRELKKPCIIGTKIATQVLRDGDLVEVDADHGVVRILERANE
jgi:phosphohistidine swiveling domain-containing protein